MNYWLPRECPACNRIISPAERPKVGDFVMCPLCDVLLVFIEDLMLRTATIQDWRDAQSQA